MPAWNQQPQPQAAYQWRRGQQPLQVNVEAHEGELWTTNNPTIRSYVQLAAQGA
jgi:hypothetical protein